MIVKKFFIDKIDHHEFNPGDSYPLETSKATEDRIAELTSKGYIEEEEVVKPKKASTRKKKE